MSFTPDASARRASSGAFTERSSQPNRIFRVTGTGAAATVASTRLIAWSRSRISADPDQPLVTCRAGQPMLISMMAAPQSATMRAPSAIHLASQPAKRGIGDARHRRQENPVRDGQPADIEATDKSRKFRRTHLPAYILGAAFVCLEFSHQNAATQVLRCNMQFIIVNSRSCRVKDGALKAADWGRVGQSQRVRPEPAIGPARDRTRWAGPMAGSACPPLPVVGTLRFAPSR